MFNRKLLTAVLYVGIGLGLCLTGLVANQRLLAVVDKVASKAREALTPVDSEEASKIATHLLDLEITSSIHLPASRDGRGGSVATVEGSIVVMTHAGDFYSVLDGEAHKLDVAAPPNGLRALERELTKPEYDGLYMDPGQFRYLDVTFVTRFNRHELYISYTRYLSEQRCYRTQIARLSLDQVDMIHELSADADDWDEVFATKPCLPLKDHSHVIAGHMAGAPLFYERSSDTLLLSSGDYHWDRSLPPSPLLPNGAQPLAQSQDNQYGKLIRINLENGTSTSISRGLRNTKGLMVDSDQRIWTVENGPRGGDELNLHSDGSDFGWPTVSLGTKYSGEPWNKQRIKGDHKGYKYPVFSWLPSIAPSEIIELNDFAPEWDGDFLLGTMYQRALHRLRIRDGKVIYDEKIPFKLRIRALTQGQDNTLHIWTDSQYLVSIRPAVNTRTSNSSRFDQFVKKQNLSTQESLALTTQLESCEKCHGFEVGINNNGPNLNAVYNRAVATEIQFTGYSKALKNLNYSIWTRENLTDFLVAPDMFAPGTYMSAQGIKERQTAELIVDYLSELQSEK